MSFQAFKKKLAKRLGLTPKKKKKKEDEDGQLSSKENISIAVPSVSSLVVESLPDPLNRRPTPRPKSLGLPPRWRSQPQSLNITHSPFTSDSDNDDHNFGAASEISIDQLLRGAQSETGSTFSLDQAGGSVSDLRRSRLLNTRSLQGLAGSRSQLGSQYSLRGYRARSRTSLSSWRSSSESIPEAPYTNEHPDSLYTNEQHLKNESSDHEGPRSIHEPLTGEEHIGDEFIVYRKEQRKSFRNKQKMMSGWSTLSGYLAYKSGGGKYSFL